MINTDLSIQLANYANLYKSMPTLPAPPKPELPALSETEKEILIEAERAWKAYSHSEQGKKELAAVSGMDIVSARQYVCSLLDKPEFARLRQLLDKLDFPEACFSIGINFEIQAFLGFSATLGVAVGVGQSKGAQAAEFVSISLIEGAEIGVMVGVEFGIWRCIPTDLAGPAWGIQAGFGLEVEGTIAIFSTKSLKLAGATLTIGGGAELGISLVESYTFILDSQGDDPYIKPVVQPRKNNFLIIESLKCEHPSNDGGGDENEVYFIFQADGDTRYPYPTYDYFSMKEGDSWACGRSVWFNNSVAVTIYDEDGTSDDDIVGTFSLSLSNLSLGQTVTIKSDKDYSSTFDKVAYTIKVKLVATNIQ